MAHTSRYTYKMLQADVKELNADLMPTGYYLVVDSRNGYTALDEYKVNPDKAGRGICVRNIEIGTPRICLAAANNYEPRTAE